MIIDILPFFCGHRTVSLSVPWARCLSRYLAQGTATDRAMPTEKMQYIHDRLSSDVHIEIQLCPAYVVSISGLTLKFRNVWGLRA